MIKRSSYLYNVMDLIRIIKNVQWERVKFLLVMSKFGSNITLFSDATLNESTYEIDNWSDRVRVLFKSLGKF